MRHAAFAPKSVRMLEQGLGKALPNKWQTECDSNIFKH